MNWQTIVKENNLDVSVINCSKVERFRIDADFYSQKFLHNENQIKKMQTYPLSELCIIKSGTTPKDRDDELREGVVLLKTTDIRNKSLASGTSYYYISEKLAEKMKSTQLQKGDVLMNIVGATLGVIGRVSIVPDDFPKANITQAMAMIRTKNESLLSGYIFTFLLSKYGNLQAQRLARPTGQYNLNLQEVSAIRIPIIDKDFQKSISKLVSDFQILSDRSVKTYNDAEQLLLKEINLEGYKTSDENVSIRNFKDCIADNRFDAEYWQPKYDEMIKKVSLVPQKELGDIVSTKKGVETGSEAYSEEGKLFIRVSDFSIYGIDEGEKRISEDLYEKLKENYRPHKGEVLFTKDGTIGISFALHEDADAIVSGAFLRLKPNIKINNDYLALALNSSFCKRQIERMSGGAIIAHLKPDSAMKIKIPMLSDRKQVELADKVSDALRLRKEAKTLLEKAKKAVEIFIEENEDRACAYLDENYE